MNHVVFFKFDDVANAQGAAARLRALAGRVPSLVSVEVGVDEVRSDRSWDLCLITRFADRQGMEAYSVHPAHQEVVSWIRERAAAVAAVDWSS